MNVYFLLALFIALPYVIYGEAIGCDPEWKEFQGNCYRVTKGYNSPHVEGKTCVVFLVEKCKAIGGNPVSIHSKEENRFVSDLCQENGTYTNGNLIVRTAHCWIGFHGKNRRNEQGNPDRSKWIDGTPIDFDIRGHVGHTMARCVSISGDPTESGTWVYTDDLAMFRTMCKKPAGPVAVVNPTSANPAPSMPEPPKPNPTKRSCHKRRRHHHRHHKHH